MELADIILRATDLTLGYAQHVVVRDVNLEVRSGDFWFCLGLNGAGKTTLLRAMLGVHPPHAGSIWLHPALAGRQRVGFVPQRCMFNPSLATTVREFVLLGTVGTSQRRRTRLAHLHWALERVGLEGLAHRDYWSLSGGQQQRALVARALVRRPYLLILDEPTTGFDPPTMEAFLHCLAALHREAGVTVFCVTHDLPFVVRYATHLLLLRDQQAVAGPCMDVLTPHTLTHVYGTGVEVIYDTAGQAAVRIVPAGRAL